MRYSAEHKAETHDRIVQLASRSFREHGSAGEGIARLMTGLGLTHGGFYRHFDSKEDLFAEVVARGFAETGDRLVAAAEAAPKGQELRAIIETYLSATHLDEPATGCVIAALAPELSRQPPALRERVNKTMEAYVLRMEKYLPGRTSADRRRNCFILFPGMAGIVATARALNSRKDRLRMLSAAKSFYLGAFASAVRE